MATRRLSAQGKDLLAGMMAGVETASSEPPAPAVAAPTISAEINRGRKLSRTNVLEKAKRRGSNVLVPPPLISQASAAKNDPFLARKLQEDAQNKAVLQKQTAKASKEELATFQERLGVHCGITALKHGRRGKPHLRTLFVPRGRPSWIAPGTPDFHCLCWTKPPAGVEAWPPLSPDQMRAQAQSDDPPYTLSETEDAYVLLSNVYEIRRGKQTEVFGYIAPDAGLAAAAAAAAAAGQHQPNSAVAAAAAASMQRKESFRKSSFMGARLGGVRKSSSVGGLGTRKSSLSIAGITGMARSGSSDKVLEAIPDELCFSLITHDRSLDLQCADKEERDHLIRGFHLLAFGRLPDSNEQIIMRK